MSAGFVHARVGEGVGFSLSAVQSPRAFKDTVRPRRLWEGESMCEKTGEARATVKQEEEGAEEGSACRRLDTHAEQACEQAPGRRKGSCARASLGAHVSTHGLTCRRRTTRMTRKTLTSRISEKPGTSFRRMLKMDTSTTTKSNMDHASQTKLQMPDETRLTCR